MDFLKPFDVVFARYNESGVEEFADPGTAAVRMDPSQARYGRSRRLRCGQDV